MERFFLAVVAGVAGSATIALLGTALLARLRTSKVLDLSLGAVAMYLAYVFFELRASGDLVLPVLGLPGRVHLIDRPTIGTSLFVVMVFAALLGAAIHALFYERLRDLPPLASLAATLGVLLYFQQLVQLRFPSNSAGVRTRIPVLPQSRLRIGPLTLSTDRLLILLLSIATATAMYMLFDRSRFGRLADATTSSTLGAMCVRIVPARIAGVGASLATAIAAFALILAEPIAGLGPTTALLVIPAVAALLLGRLRSFGATAAGALGIGAVQAVILATAVGPARGWLPSWLPISGLQALVPTVVIILVLYQRGEMLATRGTDTPVEHPLSVRSTHLTLGMAAILALTVSIVRFGDPLLRQALAVSAIAAVLYLSVVVVTGYSGQLSLLPMTTAGIAGLLCLRLVRSGLPFLVATILSLACAAGLGWAAGRSVNRLRGMNVALVTLALAVSLEALVLNSEALSGVGNTLSPAVRVFGLDLGLAGVGRSSYRPRFVLLVVGVLVLACVLTAALRSSHRGLRMLASKSNEQQAAILGVDVALSRTSAFVLASVLAGVSGILMVFSLQRPSSMSFLVVGSIVAIALTTMAGAGGVSGAVLAGVVAPGGLMMTLVSGSAGGHATTYVSALSGLALALTVGLLPDGVIGTAVRRQSRRFKAPGLPTSDLTSHCPAVEDTTDLDPDNQVRVVALTVSDIRVERDNTRILDGVSLTVNRGEIVGLMGPNGAGKTTLFDACSGLVGVIEGDVRIGTDSIVNLPVHRRVNAGLARTFQSNELFGGLTITENLQLADQNQGTNAHVERKSVVRAPGQQILTRRNNQLNPAQAMELGLEMAVASCPSVLLLDEPASGLDAEAKKRLTSKILNLAESGVAVVVCDHDPDFVNQVADRIVTLAVARLSTDCYDIRPDVAPFQASVPPSLFCSEAAAYMPGRKAPLPPMLSLGSTGGNPVHIESGEFASLSGDEGTIVAAVETIAGLNRRGKVSGYRVSGLSLRRQPGLPKLARRGLSYVPASRGLFGSMSVEQNLVLGNGNRPLTAKQLAWLADAFPEIVGVLDRLAGVLSGGEQQLLALARALISEPTTLLVDRPFHGLSSTATRHIVRRLCQVAANGTAVVVARTSGSQVSELPATERYLRLDRMEVRFHAMK